MLLANGFSVDLLVDLVRAGLPAATPERIRLGPKTIEDGESADRGRGAEGAQRSHPMTPPKKRTYDFRIPEWEVVTPEEQERIYMQLLTSERPNAWRPAMPFASDPGGVAGAGTQADAKRLPE